MPIHEYECERCGHIREELFDRDPPEEMPCPNPADGLVCGGRMKKIISKPGKRWRYCDERKE